MDPFDDLVVPGADEIIRRCAELSQAEQTLILQKPEAEAQLHIRLRDFDVCRSIIARERVVQSSRTSLSCKLHPSSMKASFPNLFSVFLSIVYYHFILGAAHQTTWGTILLLNRIIVPYLFGGRDINVHRDPAFTPSAMGPPSSEKAYATSGALG